MNLDAASLKKRERVIIDIAKHDKDIKPDEDVTQWHSDKRNIGPLRENWYRDPSYPHIMWCYKNVSIKCKYFGLQSLVENLVRKQQEMICLKEAFHKDSMRLFCTGAGLAQVISTS